MAFKILRIQSLDQKSLTTKYCSAKIIVLIKLGKWNYRVHLGNSQFSCMLSIQLAFLVKLRYS